VGETPDEQTQMEEEASSFTRPEALAAIATLMERSPHLLELLEAEVKRTRDEYAFNLARGLMKHVKTVDQREIDYKRGFWQGALWATILLPRKAQAELTRQRKADNETDEEANA